jgi:hypothetical protein
MQAATTPTRAEGRGPPSPAELIKVWEVNPMGGGKIVRDRLWFY